MTISPDKIEMQDLAKELADLKKLLNKAIGNDQGIYIEHSFQMPNFVIDFLDYYLTPAESKVLHRVVREILGWKKRQHPDKNTVAVSKMLNGKRKSDDEDACLGIGLTHETIENALNALCQYGILTKQARKQNGVVYRLNLNTNEYDMLGLHERVAKKKATNRQRTINARKENPKVKQGAN